jgi:hypothetical protein
VFKTAASLANTSQRFALKARLPNTVSPQSWWARS